jgi:DNA primase
LSPYIPDNIISEIRLNADIVDIVSNVVSLQKKGKNYVGLCPFHSEKTPSFTVTPDKGIFYCFGCGEGGDAISFVMKTEKISFPEALRLLAGKLGIQIPDRELTTGEKKALTEREKILEINMKAAGYFQHHLFKSEFAKNYLKNRGITKEIVKTFVLGYAPEGWSGLHTFLRKTGYNDRLIEISGLIVAKESSAGRKTGYYDRFRNRIIFPIKNISNQIIGFGGRVLDDSPPKYLNSPETPVYHKSVSLYGLFEARKTIHEKGFTFIVEGFFDLIALYRHGFQNAAATLGTALTKEHVKRLRNYAEKVFLVYDSDNAGIKAALRSIPLFYEGGMDAYIMVLSKGDDPDSFLNHPKKGPGQFKKEIKTAKRMDDFLIDSYIGSYGADGALRRVDEIFAPLTVINDFFKISVFILKLAETLGVD